MTWIAHHPDGYITIDGDVVVPLTLWQIMEPAYELPDGYIGRDFVTGVRHHLNKADGSQDQADIEWADGATYLVRKATYETALDVYQRGGKISNVDGEIVIVEPPTITAPATVEVAVDPENPIPAEIAMISCDVGDESYTGLIHWTITAPSGGITTESVNAVAGADSFELVAQESGTYTIECETDTHGISRKEIIAS
jgi:hypothetical protein